MGEDAGAAAGRGERRARWLAAGLVVLAVLVLVVVRYKHPIRAVGNADIGGILYQADMILAGGVPYRDAIDVKQPGAFFLVAGVFRWLGRDMWYVKVFYAFWCLLAGPAIWIAARALYRARPDGGKVAAGVAVLLYLGFIGAFDFNYSAWMATPYAWAFACLIAGIRGDRRWVHVAAGAFAALSIVTKGQAVVVAPMFALVWLWGRRRREPGATGLAWPLWIAGGLIGLLPLVLFFAWHGALRELAAGLMPIETAREYAGRVQPKEWWVWNAWKIPAKQWRVLPLHTSIAAAGVMAALWARKRPPAEGGTPGVPVMPQVIFFLMSVVGCGIGGLRYYIHYLPQYVAALSLLGAHPAILRWVLARPRSLRDAPGRLLAWAMAALVVWQAGKYVYKVPRGKASAVDNRDNRDAQRAGTFIKNRTKVHDRVQVWGWLGWPIYYWSNRKAPSPVFKVLGQVTEYNQNSLFTRPSQLHFKPGKYADMMLEAFRTAPPAFFVGVTPYFPGSRRDPLDEFKPLRDIVRRDYVMRKRFGKFRVYELKSRSPAAAYPTPPKAAERPGRTEEPLPPMGPALPPGLVEEPTGADAGPTEPDTTAAEPDTAAAEASGAEASGDDFG